MLVHASITAYACRSERKRGVKADEERWCLADISYLTYKSLDLVDALEGCMKSLDVEKLPRLLEQAETCIKNISSIMTGTISEATK